MRAKYIGSEEQGEDTSCEVFGLTFPQGEWVECDHPKLVGNPMFEAEVAPAPSARRGRPPKTPEPIDEPAPDEALEG